MATAPHVSLDADDLDDLIYLCRAGELDELKDSLKALSQKHDNVSISAIIHSAIDVDAEGLGSQSCLLHYPAANGNLVVLTYLLEQVVSGGQQEAGASSVNGVTNGITTSTAPMTPPTAAAAAFVNHRNVSGNTALHWAAMNGHMDAVKALVQAGADPTVVNGVGRDAVVEAEYSSKVGCDDCANWMLQECGGLMRGVGEGAREGESEERVEDDVNDTTTTAAAAGTGERSTRAGDGGAETAG